MNPLGSILGLDTMEELLKRPGNPERNLKVIHVAGTNGKGSVSSFLAGALTGERLSSGKLYFSVRSGLSGKNSGKRVLHSERRKWRNIFPCFLSRGQEMEEADFIILRPLSSKQLWLFISAG